MMLRPSERRALLVRRVTARLAAVQRLLAKRPELRRDTVRR